MVNNFTREKKESGCRTTNGKGYSLQGISQRDAIASSQQGVRKKTDNLRVRWKMVSNSGDPDYANWSGIFLSPTGYSLSFSPFDGYLENLDFTFEAVD